MKTNTRWINNTIAQAAACNTKMPWERGLQRQAMIARRVEQTQSAKPVSLPQIPDYMTMAVSA